MSQPQDPSSPETLSQIVAWIRSSLSRGVADPRSSFHWPTLATVTAEGEPRMRTVVLRGHDAERRELSFFTDRRSDKCPEIEAAPGSAVHVYDGRKKIQLRLRGTSFLHFEGEAWERAWERVRRGRTADYSHAPKPGSPVRTFDGFEPQGADPESQFTLVRFVYRSADYLHLGKSAHRRARIDFASDPAVATWLVP
ncbi:MAG: pyridoxamine 5'-phosphate oxidase family protein [Acidobacteriota bacterium]